MTDLAAAFLTYAEKDRDRSPHTLARYRAVLASVAQYGPLSTITAEQVEQWWATRFDKSPSTRANELACLRSFFRWAARFDHRPDDPTRRLDPPRVTNHVPRPIGQTDLERLLGPLTVDAPDLRRAIALGAYSGLRVSEAAGLTWANIDQDGRRIYVRGKGKKERVFGLSPTLLDKLLPAMGGNVVTAGGSPYTGATLQRKINRLMERAEIAHTFHDLRKRAAGLAMDKTRNPVAVAQAFGWQSIETASSYAVVSDEALDVIAAAVI